MTTEVAAFRHTVLWLARTIPLPLNAGDRIYTAGLATNLARAGARVTYLGLANPDEPMGSRGALWPAVEWIEVPGGTVGRIRALASSKPLVAARFATSHYKAEIAERLRRSTPDTVVLDQYALVWALPIVARAIPRPKLIYVAHDAEMEVTREIARAYRGSPIRKALLWLNAHKTKRAEIALLRGCDALVTLTEGDGEALAAFNPAIARIVVPPGYEWEPRPPRVMTSDIPRRVVVLGSYRWIAKQMNLEHFLRHAVGPFCRAGIYCCVIGAIPEDVLRKWRTAFPTVEFMGFVEDVQPVLDQSRFGLVVETTGGGFKLKMLDYLFRRIPMAGIETGLQGLPESVSRHVLSAPDAERLTAAVIASIDDLNLLQAMQTKAFQAARHKFDWRRNGERLYEFLQSLQDEPTEGPIDLNSTLLQRTSS